MNRPTNVFFKDSEFLDSTIPIYVPEHGVVLDCTYNKGKIWKETTLQNRIVRSDISALSNLDVITDFQHLPYAKESIHGIVFDPPHMRGSTGNGVIKKGWDKEYGLGGTDDGKYTIRDYFMPFLSEAHRTLCIGGCVFAKLIDPVRCNKKQLEHVWFIQDALTCGFLVEDVAVKVRIGKQMESSKWKNVYHLRNAFSFWLVVKKV